MRRNGSVGGHRVAVLLMELPSHVGVQRFVERPDLAPQPVQLPGEGVGRHVVFGAPHRAVVGESDFARSLVGEHDVALEVFFHRRPDGVPAAPHVEQLARVAAIRHDLRDVVDVEALVLLGAILALAVAALHPGCDPGQLLALLGIGRRGDGQRQLEELQLALQVGRELQLLESGRLLHKIDGRRDRPLVRPRGQNFRVPGNEIGLDPTGSPGLGDQVGQSRFHVVQEGLGLGRGGQPAGGGQGDCNSQTCEQASHLHSSTPVRGSPCRMAIFDVVSL